MTLWITIVFGLLVAIDALQSWMHRREMRRMYETHDAQQLAKIERLERLTQLVHETKGSK